MSALSSPALTSVLQPHTFEPDVETASDGYAARFAGSVGTYFLERQRQIVERLLPAGRPLSILDVGGGHGQLTELLVSSGHEVWVQGSSPTCFERLRPQFGARVRFTVCPLDALPFDSQSFDVVTAFRLIPHIAETELFLHSIARIAKQQILFDYAPSTGFNALSPLLFGAKKRIEGNTREYFTHSHDRLKAMLEAEGYCRISSEKQFFMPMGLHRALGLRPVSEVAEAISRRAGLVSLWGSPAICSACRGPA